MQEEITQSIIKVCDSWYRQGADLVEIAKAISDVYEQLHKTMITLALKGEQSVEEYLKSEKPQFYSSVKMRRWLGVA